MEKYIVYVRVSTNKQGSSGLGLQSQHDAVSSFFASRQHEIVSTYTEVESGKRSDRPELLKALEECKRRKAVLVIAKLDRLARNVHFISGLMESNVDFVCCDNPTANRLMLHMLAAFAEHEREIIGQRTKAALAVAKAKGIELGVNGKLLAKQNRELARQNDQKYYPVVCKLMRELRSYTAVAEEMNKMSITTTSGSRWYGSSIRNICLRAL